MGEEINYEGIRAIVSDEIGKTIKPITEKVGKLDVCVFGENGTNGLNKWRIEVDTIFKDRAKNKRDWKNNLVGPLIAGIGSALCMAAVMHIWRL